MKNPSMTMLNAQGLGKRPGTPGMGYGIGADPDPEWLEEIVVTSKARPGRGRRGGWIYNIPTKRRGRGGSRSRLAGVGGPQDQVRPYCPPGYTWGVTSASPPDYPYCTPALPPLESKARPKRGYRNGRSRFTRGKQRSRFTMKGRSR